MSVSVSGSSGTVNVTITGLPSGVSASPSQFSVNVGAQQTVAVTASSGASPVSVNLTISGTENGTTHSVQEPLLVNLAQQSPHPPFRTGFARTDAQWDVGFINFAPQRWVIYHQPTRRFFVTNTFLNRIDVIDATTEQIVAQIPVPGAFVGDDTPDHSAIYMGTQVGDVYKIDPVNMTVIQRYPAAQIGPNGFPAYIVRVLADGRLAMLGSQGGIPAVDGYSALAIWNPADNSFFIAPRFSALPSCPIQDHILEFALTADRTKVLLGSGVSGGALCSYDPVSDAQVAVATNPQGIGVRQILTPADGKEIIVPDADTVNVYDAAGLFQTDAFQVGTSGIGNAFDYVLSLDGNTLYVFPRVPSAGDVLAYNWRTHQLLGWSPSMDFLDLGTELFPAAVDETGLITAIAAHGISFLEGAALHPGAPTSVVTNTFVSPSFGPTAGGTNITYTFIATPPATNSVFFGNQLAANLALAGEGVTATSPPGAAGPVDITAVLPDGNLVYSPESFNYGPSIVEIATDSSTGEGGATGTVFGYGFGTPRFGGQAASGLQVLINGQAATNLKYTPNPLDSVSIGPDYFFPIESIGFTFPPGTAGKDVDLTISDGVGSATATQAIHYLPATKQFPLPGSVLVQGIYDPKRDVYYFSDATKVQVFSKTQGTWLAPINMPAGASRLWGLSLSPDSSKLAVSDVGVDRIYVLNPDTPGTISTFNASAASDPTGGEPAGLAIADSGVIYYMMFYTQETGPPGLHKLDTVSGTITPFQAISADQLAGDALTRVLLSNDNARVYVNTGDIFVELDTATDTMFFNFTILPSDAEMALASNQTWMAATEWVMDTNLNPESFLTITDRQGVSITAVFGAKLSPDGSLLFQPLVDGLAVFDGKLGTLRTRIALPFALSANFDALVADGNDNVLLGIVGENGDGGVAVIDLTAVPVPLFQARACGDKLPMKLGVAYGGKQKMRSNAANPKPAVTLRPPNALRLPHAVNDLKGKTGVRVIP